MTWWELNPRNPEWVSKNAIPTLLRLPGARCVWIIEVDRLSRYLWRHLRCKDAPIIANQNTAQVSLQGRAGGCTPNDARRRVSEGTAPPGSFVFFPVAKACAVWNIQLVVRYIYVYRTGWNVWIARERGNVGAQKKRKYKAQASYVVIYRLASRVLTPL